MAFFGSAAGAQAASVVASPTCCTYETGPFVQGLGETATFDNSQSTSPHDVASTQTGPDGQPLFFSDAILGGQSTPIQGTEYLAAGTYPFYCTIHGAAMSGQLTVDGASGTVVPRPSVKVSVLKQKLKQLRKKGVLRVKVAATAGGPITLVLAKGKAEIARKEGLSFTAGQAKTVAFRLGKTGRRAVKKGKKVKLRIDASVPFGNPTAASRTFR